MLPSICDGIPFWLHLDINGRYIKCEIKVSGDRYVWCCLVRTAEREPVERNMIL